MSAFLKAREPKEGTTTLFSYRQNSLPSFVLEATVLQTTGVLGKNSGSQVPFQVFGIKLSDVCSRNLHLWQGLQIFFMRSKVWGTLSKIALVQWSLRLTRKKQCVIVREEALWWCKNSARDPVVEAFRRVREHVREGCFHLWVTSQLCRELSFALPCSQAGQLHYASVRESSKTQANIRNISPQNTVVWLVLWPRLPHLCGSLSFHMHLEWMGGLIFSTSQWQMLHPDSRAIGEETSYLHCFLCKKKQSIQCNNRHKKFKREKFLVEIWAND